MSGPRVLHVVVAGEIGGAEHMLVELARGAPESAVEHAVALFTPNPALRRFLVEAGLRVHDRGPASEHPIAHLRRAFGPGDAAWLGRVMALEGADIVQAHTFGSHALAARAARGRACLVRTEHSTRVYHDAWCWWLSRPSLLAADAVVAISAHVRAVALAHAPAIAPRLRVIHNGVDTVRHRPSGEPRVPHPFTFATVARLDPRKGIDQALRALARVPAARLVVVGDGPERARLEALARTLGLGARVRFAGEQRDPRPFVRGADAALCSSRQEGLSLALLEAMAHALPVVAFPVGGVPEFVRDGDTGWLAADNSVAALAAAMQAAIAVPRAELTARGARGRAEVERRFSREAMCTSWRTLYAELIAGSPAVGFLSKVMLSAEAISRLVS